MRCGVLQCVVMWLLQQWSPSFVRPWFLVVQSVAVCCSLLWCVAVCCNVAVAAVDPVIRETLVSCVALCRSVLQCVAVCCSVLQCVPVCCSVLQCVVVCCRVLLMWLLRLLQPLSPSFVRPWFHVLQCVAVCCTVLQCVVVL